MQLKEAVLDRWSPKSFVLNQVDETLIVQIFETVRWAHSAFNEQPWRFMIATPDDGLIRNQLEQLLNPGNAYAKQAWVLGLVAARRQRLKDGLENRHCLFDTGAACQLLSLKAFELGLGTRFMAGFNLEGARKLVPDDLEPIALFVIGHRGSEGVTAPAGRMRKPVAEFLFRGHWPERS